MINFLGYLIYNHIQTVLTYVCIFHWSRTLNNIFMILCIPRLLGSRSRSGKREQEVGAGVGAGSDIFKSSQVGSDFLYILMHICQQKYVEWWIRYKKHKNMRKRASTCLLENFLIIYTFDKWTRRATSYMTLILLTLNDQS